jgi:cysteine desulfurase
MLGPDVRLICVMQVCNETGAIMPIAEVAKLRDAFAPEAAIHVDGVQGYLRVPFSKRETNVQTYAVSAHKVHGPKGVGALMVAPGHRLKPILFGGGQQQNLRSGTENTCGIAGFAAAVAAFPPAAEAEAKLAGFKRLAAETLSAAIPEFRVLGPAPGDADAAPHILYAAFPPVRAETMVHALEARGDGGHRFGLFQPHNRGSDVLSAIRCLEASQSAVRLSFAVDKTEEESATPARRSRAVRVLAPFTRR